MPQQVKLKMVCLRSNLSGLKKVIDYTKIKRVVYNTEVHGHDYFEFNERKEFNELMNKQLTKKQYHFGSGHRNVHLTRKQRQQTKPKMFNGVEYI